MRDVTNDVGTLVLDSALWGGGLSKTQIPVQFGKITEGTAMLDLPCETEHP